MRVLDDRQDGIGSGGADKSEQTEDLLFFDHLDGFIGDLSVRLFRVLAFGLHPRNRCSQVFIIDAVIDNFAFVVLVAPARVDDLVP